MIVGTVKETHPGERRVALTPHVLPLLSKAGCEVLIEAGAGLEAGFPDHTYTEKGARVASIRKEVFDAAERPDLQDRLADPGYRARIERFVIFHVVAFDWNCPQHITPRFTEAELAELEKTPQG